MPDETEHMEARLAAYIDNALPPEQRAEIESYFKTNPSHARLITELASIKAAVAALPRDKAPAEVLDTLQSHLERQSLLDGGDETASTARINRWPQLGAVAAMLLLTAGLGFLVYRVLPRGEAAGPQLALLSSTTRPDDGGLGEVAGGMPGGGGGPGGGISLRDVSPTTGPVGGVITANEATAGGPALAGRPRAMTRGAAGMVRPSDPAVGAAASQGFSPSANQPVTAFGAEASPESVPTTGPGRTPLGEDARVLVVSSDDPALTQNLLAASLAAEGTAFELPPPGSLANRPTTTAPAGDAGDASAGSVAGEAGARPVVVRNLPAERVDTIRRTIDRQRPGRQFVVSTAAAADNAAAERTPANTAPAATRPATGPAMAAGVRLDRSTPAAAPTAAEAPAVAAPASTGPMIQNPATQPAGKAGRDLVIFIVPTPPQATPVAAKPTTAPATRPASGPAEEMP